jgi:hypothetical protein
VATNNRSGLSGGYSFEAQIDMEKIAKAIEIYGDEIKFVGVPRAINRGGQAGTVRLIRALAGQTGLTSTLVRKNITTEKANRSRWRFTFKASSKALGLSAFGLRGKVGSGKRSRPFQVWAKPWGVKTVFKNAFIVRTKGGQLEAFKRSAGKHGRHNIKMLYGPIISYEMVRQGGGHQRASVQEILKIAEDVAIRRLPHEMNFAFEQAKAKSGT